MKNILIDIAFHQTFTSTNFLVIHLNCASIILLILLELHFIYFLVLFNLRTLFSNIILK